MNSSSVAECNNNIHRIAPLVRAMTIITCRVLVCCGAIIVLSGQARDPSLPKIKSIGVIAAIGDTCMFERIPDRPFAWIAPPQASFLGISDWGLDDEVTDAITKRLKTRYRVQTISFEHQDFDAWTYQSLARHIRELPLPETPVDAYLLVLRDWRHDDIGGTNHDVGGLGLYRRDVDRRAPRVGVFASWRLVLANPDNGSIIATLPALLPDGRLPWLPAAPSFWSRSQNDLTGTQRRTLRSDFAELVDASLPGTLKRMGFVF